MRSILQRTLSVCALSFLAVIGASAASITFNLTCVLNGLDSNGCVSGPNFGAVTLATTANANQLTLTVDLAGTGEKFRDLMLNYNGAASSIGSLDGLASLSANAFSIAPYSGKFDIGKSGGQGWNGNDGYTTTLTGNAALSLTDFAVLDSAGNVFVALHIQNIGSSNGGSCTGADDGSTNCAPGQTGPGSLKVGGVGTLSSDAAVPEPATSALFLAGIALVAIKLRKGN